MRVILSIGLGRLHFVDTASSLARANVEVLLICGWVPRKPNSLLVKLASKIVGRDLSSGMKKRIIKVPGVRVCPLGFVEFFYHAVRVVGIKMKLPVRSVQVFAWRLFGCFSRRGIVHADIFHCRSGAGQGGAIATARKRGMKILVDHSALHPAISGRNLQEDYARWGQPLAISPHLGVWEVVLEDCREADMIMVNANHIRDSFVEQGYSPAMIRVVHLGVRSDFFSLKKSYKVGATIRILYTGAFSILKGAEYTLETIRILTDRGLSVQLDVYGSLDVPVAMRKRYEGLKIVYHGSVPQDDLKRALSSSDIYLFPSLADGCAQSGMEALAAGLPVVATYQSGLPITDGETGCVVPMKDPRTIADKIEWLNRHGTDRERIGRAAARLIREKYTWEKYAENVKKVYEELLVQ